MSSPAFSAFLLQLVMLQPQKWTCSFCWKGSGALASKSSMQLNVAEMLGKAHGLATAMQSGCCAVTEARGSQVKKLYVNNDGTETDSQHFLV